MKLISILLTNYYFAKVFFSCKKPGQLALTFDDGPSPYTGNLLNILNDKNIKASFHFTTDYLNVPYVAAYVQQAQNDGHLIGIMSKTPIKNIKLDDEAHFNGLKKLQSDIETITNQKPSYLTLPYEASYPKDLIEKYESMGFTVTSHNLDSEDYNNSSQPYLSFKKQLDAIVPPAKGSFISLQHDTAPKSVNETNKIIDLALDKGYKLVRLDECVGKYSESSNSGKGDKKSNQSNSSNDNEAKDTKNSSHNSSPKLSVKWIYSLSTLTLSLLL
ncbi:carbohydrate esterase family 4 protein [Conidiobolus coronatus NRRL 28638]|uniref:Carbohydrate esterase family 4 protein n=1 Tax=Conidiobolus coronatus (strain ATCC 28846 / CBS 209.66 / NRRL 28638) TaxID=796925 RepID=A0A137NWN0_CONC2|nr:carbohydrate esterase family 4 protein [Conidiobolus coronatus NRRL 28638]|eukprot:KXN67245.1 carbohydrate esterase family 4 protein [Conidiobolus coronatus NRRL 28638]